MSENHPDEHCMQILEPVEFKQKAQLEVRDQKVTIRRKKHSRTT
jgi:hypothetical protein